MSNIENHRVVHERCEKYIAAIQPYTFFEGVVDGRPDTFLKVETGIVSLTAPGLHFEAEKVYDYCQIERPAIITKPCSKKLGEIPYGTYFSGTLRTERAVYSGLFLRSSLGLVGLNGPSVDFWSHGPLVIENYVEKDVAVE